MFALVYMLSQNTIWASIFSLVMLILTALYQFLNFKTVYLNDDGIKIVSKINSRFMRWDDISEFGIVYNPLTQQDNFELKSSKDKITFPMVEHWEQFGDQVAHKAGLKPADLSFFSEMINKNTYGSPKLKKWVKK